MSSFTSRLLGSASLNAQTYEEVEADKHANLQAVAVVVISSIAAALGVGIKSVGDTVSLIVVFVILWVFWVVLTVLIGTQLLPEAETRADFGQVLRTTGFSAAPGILRVVGLIPVIGNYLFVGVMIWMLFSFVVAIRQALDYRSTGRALAVSLLGWIITGVLLFGFVKTAI